MVNHLFLSFFLGFYQTFLPPQPPL
jgi:hypothetical protein